MHHDGQRVIKAAEVYLVQIAGVSDLSAKIPGRVLMAEYDPDQLERLMVEAFRLLGKPEGQSRELARAILKAAEPPQSDDPEPQDRGPTRRLS
jgi:hypothetical protein